MNKTSLIHLLLLLIAIAATSSFAAIAKPASLEWLKFSDDVRTQWRIETDSSDTGLMTISPRWDSSVASLQVFMLVPKESASYRLAIYKFLEVMQQNNLPTDITLIHFGNDDTRGRWALDRAEEENVDLIFSIGSESAALVHTYFQDRKIPVVTSTNKDPVLLGMIDDYKKGSGNNIAYTSLNISIDVQMNYLLTLRPNLKTLGLLYNRNHKQVMATEVIPLKKKFKRLGLTIVDIAVSSRGNAKIELKKRMPEAIKDIEAADPSLENSLLWITSSTAAFAQIATINEFSGNIPVLGSVPNIVKEGDNSAVLAIGIDRRNNAHLASIYAVQILKKQVKVSELPVGVVTPPDIAINFLVAKKIGLKVPFQFFESASFIYNYEGEPARMFGQASSIVRRHAPNLGTDVRRIQP